MNIDKKLELAQETLLKLLDKVAIPQDFKDSVSLAWVMTDAMEVEYNKRKQAETEKNAKQSKILFDNLNKNENGSCQHIITSLDKTWCFDCGGKLNITNSSQLEFQPDWSVAPDGYDWWAVDRWGAWWFDQEPKWWINGEWGGYVVNKNNRSATEKALSFDYDGDWRDSLRKRPQ